MRAALIGGVRRVVTSAPVYLYAPFATSAAGVAIIGGAKINNGVATTLGTLSTTLVSRGASGMAIHPITKEMYICGSFTSINGVAANYVAKWNDTAGNWVALSSGPPNAKQALCFDSSGNLYAGGTGGSIHKWDGASWTAFGGVGANWQIDDMAFSPAGELHIVGDFTTVSGVSARGVAKYNGSAWVSLNTAVTGVAPLTLAFSAAGRLVVGGSFTALGGVARIGIAEWVSGTTWQYPSAVAGGISGGQSVLKLAFDSGGNLWAGGTFTVMNSVSVGALAKLVGSTWTNVGNFSTSTVRAIVCIGSDVYVGGDFTTITGVSANRIAKSVDGLTFTAIGAGVNATVYVMAGG